MITFDHYHKKSTDAYQHFPVTSPAVVFCLLTDEVFDSQSLVGECMLFFLSATLLSAGPFYVLHEAMLRKIRQLYTWQHCTFSGLVRKAFDCVCMPMSLKLFSLLNRCTYCVHVLQILLVVCQLHAVQLLIKKAFSACVIAKLA